MLFMRTKLVFLLLTNYCRLSPAFFLDEIDTSRCIPRSYKPGMKYVSGNRDHTTAGPKYSITFLLKGFKRHRDSYIARTNHRSPMVRGSLMLRVWFPVWDGIFREFLYEKARVAKWCVSTVSFCLLWGKMFKIFKRCPRSEAQDWHRR